MFKVLLLVALSVTKPVPENGSNNIQAIISNADTLEAIISNADTLEATKYDAGAQLINTEEEAQPESSISDEQPINTEEEAQPESSISDEQPINTEEEALPDNSMSDEVDGNTPCLNWHNKVRKSLDAPLFTWDEGLASEARDAVNATFLLESNSDEHGENTLISPWTLFSCETAMAHWVRQAKNYDGQPIGEGNFTTYSDYTQIAYPQADKLGCALKGHRAVCKYNAKQKLGTVVADYNGPFPDFNAFESIFLHH